MSDTLHAYEIFGWIIYIDWGHLPRFYGIHRVPKHARADPETP